MHFTCVQCRHQFCSGCNNPYYTVSASHTRKHTVRLYSLTAHTRAGWQTSRGTSGWFAFRFLRRPVLIAFDLEVLSLYLFLRFLSHLSVSPPDEV